MAFRLAFAILLASALAGPSPTFAQDCASLAEDPVQTVTAGGVTMQVDVRHIFCGETTSRTRSGGFHSILGFGQPGAPTAILLATPPDVFPPAGSIHFPEGQAKYSSLFPFHCGFEETLASILHATVSPQRDIREGGIATSWTAPLPRKRGRQVFVLWWMDRRSGFGSWFRRIWRDLGRFPVSGRHIRLPVNGVRCEPDGQGPASYPSLLAEGRRGC